MLLSEEHKTLILKLDNPGRVLGVVPGAKESGKYPGIVYVPHNTANTGILRSLGMKKTPSPVHYGYDWPGRFTPYKHQVTTSDFLVGYKRGFVLNDVGAGKTNASLWAADYLMNLGEIRKVLIISPLSTLERVWGDTLWSDFHHRKFAILHGSAERRLKLFNDAKYDFYVINQGGLPIISKALVEREDIDLILMDEATYVKNPSTSVHKLLYNITNKLRPPKYMWMMTATPTPNAPYEAWGMARIMGTHQGYSYTAFKDATMRKIGPFRWVPRDNCQELVQQLLSPAVRFKTSECIDLPPCTYHTRQCELTPQQKKLIAEMKQKCVIESKEGNTIGAVNEADKASKILQLACGFAYGINEAGDRTADRFDCKARVALLNEIIEETPSKLIIFVPFTELVHVLKEELSAHTCEVVDGSVTANHRNTIFKSFQETDSPRIIIAHPKTMSHGLTLTAAATIVWYAPYPSNEVYEQANGRINRPSQTRTTNIFHLEATSFERTVYERLRNRQKLQGSLLEYIKSKEM